MKTHVLMCLALNLAGCSSLQNAGVSTYSVKPFKVNDEVLCCEVAIASGREIGKLKARIEKKGADFVAEVEIDGVKAFEGQALSASVLPGVSENVTNWLRR